MKQKFLFALPVKRTATRNSIIDQTKSYAQDSKNINSFFYEKNDKLHLNIKKLKKRRRKVTVTKLDTKDISKIGTKRKQNFSPL